MKLIYILPVHNSHYISNNIYIYLYYIFISVFHLLPNCFPVAPWLKELLLHCTTWQCWRTKSVWCVKFKRHMIGSLCCSAFKNSFNSGMEGTQWNDLLLVGLADCSSSLFMVEKREKAESGCQRDGHCQGYTFTQRHQSAFLEQWWSKMD